MLAECMSKLTNTCMNKLCLTFPCIPYRLILSSTWLGREHSSHFTTKETVSGAVTRLESYTSRWYSKTRTQVFGLHTPGMVPYRAALHGFLLFLPPAFPNELTLSLLPFHHQPRQFIHSFLSCRLSCL